MFSDDARIGTLSFWNIGSPCVREQRDFLGRRHHHHAESGMTGEATAGRRRSPRHVEDEIVEPRPS